MAFFSGAAKQITANIVGPKLGLKADASGNYSPKEVAAVANGEKISAPVNPGSVSVSASSPSGPDWLSGAGSLLGAAGSVIGGLLNYKEQKKANKIAQQQFAENLAFQKDQFYNAMQHRVQDAIKAGVHPLAALGVSAHGSASPTAHVQSATGLGQAVSSLSSSINSYFENAVKQSQLDMIQSQIATNKALAIKYSADAGRQIAETAYTNKELSNYNVYRIWDRINNSINAFTSFGRFMPRKTQIDAINNYREFYMQSLPNFKKKE